MAVTPTYLIVQRNLPGYMGAAEYARHAEVRAILERSDDTTLGAWVATVRSHPSARSYVDQLGRKLHFFWLGVDFWNNIRCSYLRLLSPILAACVVWWGVLGPWTALGVVRALASRARRRDALPLVAAFLSLGIATALASGVYTRYRMVVAPLACVLFALTVVDAATHISKKSWLPRAVGAGVVLLGVVLHLAWRDPQPPLTPDALTGYVAGTWPHSRRARDHLLERVERSRSR